MRAVKFSLTACVMATMFLGVVVAHAIAAQAPKKPVHRIHTEAAVSE
jgi:hypothetical protein